MDNLKMKKLSTIIALLILTISQKTIACDCNYAGNFLTVAPNANLVALVKVIKYLNFEDIYEKATPMSMEVEVIEIYKGFEERKIVTIWGDNGVLCRPYLSQFEIDKYYVIAFDKGSDGTKGFSHKDEKITDYSISNCGDYWLDVDIKSQSAIGVIGEKQNEITLVELKEKLKSK